MSISQTKYINIVSAVGGSSQVARRDLMGRVFTSNYLVPANQVIEFTGGSVNALASIGEYFGTTSKEYAFASLYFQPSKTGTSPSKISFARYDGLTSAPATLTGSVNASTLGQLQAISNGTLTYEVEGNTYTAEDINLSAATSLEDVATTLTNLVNTNGVIVTYDAINQRFVMKTQSTGQVTLGFATGTVATALGWTSTTGILSDGLIGNTVLGAVSASAEVSNNFFSFTFLDYDAGADARDLMNWVHSQNVRYMWSLSGDAETVRNYSRTAIIYNGIGLTLDKFDNYASFMPMSRIAAIDYSQPGAALSMDYQQFSGVEPSVLTNSEAASYDSLGINYYGATQQAGQQVAWYQPGVLSGAITDMGVYANEAWLKDSFYTDLLNLRLGLNSLPANNTGVGMVMASLMQTINLALYNGVILPGKTLDSTQKSFITQISGNPDAWQSVQGSGYYLDADVQKYTENGREKFKISYLLIYSKGDSVNYIDGRDILI